MPGAAEVVESLRADGRLLALATSSLAGFAARALDGLGLAGAFDAAVTGDEVGAGKPDPEIYALAASRLGVEPAACVAIEDTPAGVAAATAAGMTCIAVPHPLANRSGLAGAHVVADDLHTAAAEIRRLDAARVLTAGRSACCAASPAYRVSGLRRTSPPGRSRIRLGETTCEARSRLVHFRPVSERHA